MPRLHESSAFRDWFTANVSANAGTYQSYRAYLGRLDRACEEGLDAAFDTRGAGDLWNWACTTIQAPFDRDPSNLRSALKRYIEFRQVDASFVANAVEGPDSTLPDQQTVFRLEQEMQAAVRRQLDALEPGLIAVDGGLEQAVTTGRIDILARDASGRFVVIELKAGRCPSSAIEQALGYAQAIHEEHDVPVRVILIAAEFSERTRAAAKRIVDFSLFTYQFSMKFDLVS